MTPVVISLGGSLIVFMAFEHEGDVDFDFWKAWFCILKRSVMICERYVCAVCGHATSTRRWADARWKAAAPTEWEDHSTN